AEVFSHHPTHKPDIADTWWLAGEMAALSVAITVMLTVGIALPLAVATETLPALQATVEMLAPGALIASATGFAIPTVSTTVIATLTAAISPASHQVSAMSGLWVGWCENTSAARFDAITTGTAAPSAPGPQPNIASNEPNSTAVIIEVTV
ncbi:MAG: hypothetical protein AAFR52_00625, partial [Pseudomonadota bacterium]